MGRQFYDNRSPNVLLTFLKTPWLSSYEYLPIRILFFAPVMMTSVLCVLLNTQAFVGTFQMRQLRCVSALLQINSIRWHEVICCKIGVDRIYILHIVATAVCWVIHLMAELFCPMATPSWSVAVIVISRILKLTAYVYYAVPAYMLYINTFRYTVITFQIDPNILYKRILKIIAFVQLVDIPVMVILFLCNNKRDYLVPVLTIHNVLILPICSFATYMALDESTWTFRYIFSRQRTPIELIFAFVGIVIVALMVLIMPHCNGKNNIERQLLRSGLYAIKESVAIATYYCLWHYGFDMIKEYEFQCLDRYDSDLEDHSINEETSTSNYLSLASGNWRKLGFSDFEPSDSYTMMT